MRSSLMSSLATRPLARGAVAGFAGALAMSVSTNVEMRLRGRPPSDAPAQALSRLPGVNPSGRRAKAALTNAGHLATSVSLGTLLGAMDRTAMPRAAAPAALLGLALLPEIVVVPALGAAAPPWRWSAPDAAVSVIHHGVYAATAAAAYEALGRR